MEAWWLLGAEEVVGEEGRGCKFKGHRWDHGGGNALRASSQYPGYDTELKYYKILPQGGNG